MATLTYENVKSSFPVGGMVKLEKRQLIILGIMGVVILYAAFDFMTGSSKKGESESLKSPAEIGAFAGDITVALTKNTLTDSENYARERAEEAWPRNPFLDGKTYKRLLAAKEAQEEINTKKITFNYTGYLEYNKEKMAIINGIEYRSGDSLETKGFILESISPEKVVIKNKKAQERIVVPLEES